MTSFPLDIHPEMELLDHVLILFFLIFGGTSILFSIVAIRIYIPTNSAQEFPFLTSWPTSVISCPFDESHSNMYEVIYSGFDLYFPND